MILWAWWLACGPGNGDCNDGPVGVEIGTGTTSFRPLADGDDVTMVFGPQGGWHIDVAARIDGIGPDVAIRPSASRIADALPLAGDQASSFVALTDYEAGACQGDAIGIRAFLDDATPDEPYADFICSLDGASLSLVVEVSDFGSRTATDEIEVIARPDPNQGCP